MQKNSRHFSDIRPKRIGVFPREEKQFSQPTRPRKVLDHVCDALESVRLKVRDRKDARSPARVTRALPEPHSASQLHPHRHAGGSLEFAPTAPATFEREENRLPDAVTAHRAINQAHPQ